LKYFRIAENGRLLVGGRGGTSNRTTKKQIQELKLFATEMFPNIGGVEFDYVWGGNVALTLDHFPQICSFDNGIISLSGYNGRGVALTTTLGRVVGEFLNGKPALELDFPVKRLKTIPFQEFQKVIVPFAAWYKKLLDSIDR
jgi:glycine/D-amino acid oxidase-like deaminating enzyme